MKYNQLAKRNPHHVMIHGYPKTGKSTLAAQLAEEGYHLWWLSLDNGHTVLDKLSPEAQERIDIVVLPDTKEFPVAAGTINTLLKGKATKICDDHGQVNCSTCLRNKDATWTTIDTSTFGPKDILVIDHISQLAESVITLVAKRSLDKDETYKMEWDDYAGQGTLMSRMLSNVQQAPYHIICIAHSIEVKLEDGTKLLVPQVGTRAFSDTVGKYFDTIVYAGLKNSQHRFGSSTLYSAGILTGSRIDVAVEKASGKAILAELFKSAAPGQYAETATKTEEVLISLKEKTETPKPAEPEKLPEDPKPVSTPQVEAKPAPSVQTVSEAVAARLAKLKGLK